MKYRFLAAFAALVLLSAPAGAFNTLEAVSDSNPLPVAVMSGGGGSGGTPVVFVGEATASGNAYSITSPTPSGFTLTDQYVVRWVPPATNTGASTLNVGATGATAVEVQTDGGFSALVGGELSGGQEYDTSYNSTCTCFVLLNKVGASVTDKTAGYTVTAADWAAQNGYISTAAQTFTLPVSSSLSPNGKVSIFALSGNLTIAPNAADAINGGTTGASVTVAAGNSVVLTTNGAGKIRAQVSVGQVSQTANVIYKGNGTGAPVASALSDNGTLVSSSEPVDVQGNSLVYEVANASTTGTTANHLAKLSGGAAVIPATSDTDGALGVVIGGAGTSGSAQIAARGTASCIFDGATTAGDWVIISSTTAGDCHDSASATRPTAAQAIGRVTTTNGSAGTYAVILDLGYAGSGSGGSGTPGGAPGQVEVNSGGSFGGITIGGDGTLNTSTGALTVTKTNGTSLGTLATQSAPTGATQCLHVNSSGVVTGTGSDCSSSGSATPVIFVGASTNSGNTYTVTTTPSGFTLTDQYVLRWTPSATNTAAVLVNADSTGNIAVERQTTSGFQPLVGGELVSGAEYDTVYASSCNCFVLTNAVTSGVANKTASFSLQSADWSAWNYFNLNAASITVTLPASSTLSTNGGTILFANGASATLAPNAADSINGGTAGASVTIPSGSIAFVTTNGAGTIYAAIPGSSSGTATAANGLNSATTTVVVNGAAAPSAGQVLTATSSTAANWQTPSGGSGGPAFHPGFVAGNFYSTPGWYSQGSAFFLAANHLYAIPFYNPNSSATTFTKESVYVATGAASTACELGVYANNGGIPGSLIIDAGNVPVTATGNEEISAGLSIPIPSGWSWLVVGCNGSAQINGVGNTTPSLMTWLAGGASQTGTTQVYGAWSYTTGASVPCTSGCNLPASFPTPVYNSSAGQPLVYLRL